jgi:sugar phosphate isomerase/epimerase
MRKFGLQMFTVRDALSKDLPGTLRQVAAAGYAGIEMFGPYGSLVYENHRDLLAELNLQVLGGHILLDTVQDEARMARTAQEYAALGAKHLALAWLHPDHRGGLADYRRVADLCSRAGAIARDAGITFAYHNHDFEFKLVEDGRTAHQVLCDESDPDLLKIELDSFWVQKAGLDPVAVIHRLGSRISVLHAKDMTHSDERTFEILGEGRMDFDAIFAAADRYAIDWYVVEQDVCPQGEIESARRSAQNIAARGWK